MPREWRSSHFVYLDVSGSVHGETKGQREIVFIQNLEGACGQFFQFFQTLNRLLRHKECQ